MKLILSTSNVMSGGSTIRRDPTQKSNTELVSSLRANFAAHSQPANSVNGHSKTLTRTNYRTWTHVAPDGRNELEVPRLDFEHTGLKEERTQYDITVKLFFLPGADTSTRERQAREALQLVLKDLHVSSIDLLIVSFPGIYFDEEEDCPTKLSTRGPKEASPEPPDSLIQTWEALEKLHEDGLVTKLGIAEFGHDRLDDLLGKAKIRPSVNQINLRDCCSVPKNLLTLAKTHGVDLLVHNDCSNVLPRGTVRDLLGPEADGGAGVLAESEKEVKTGEKRKSAHVDEGPANGKGENAEGLHGEVQPLWVVKYTAVVRNRGVVEDKGYFAVAELSQWKGSRTEQMHLAPHSNGAHQTASVPLDQHN